MRTTPAGLLVAAVSLLMAACSGCLIAADLVSPGFVSALGLDPGVFFPSRGMVVVSFTNNATSPATFYAFESVDATDLTRQSRNFSVTVDPGETRNEVLICPVGLISLGTLDANFQPDDVGARAGDDDITYTGAALVGGRDFDCGYLIVVRLIPVAGELSLSVQVLPGR